MYELLPYMVVKHEQSIQQNKLNQRFMQRYRKMLKNKLTETITNETKLTEIKENCGKILKKKGSKKQDTHCGIIV